LSKSRVFATLSLGDTLKKIDTGLAVKFIVATYIIWQIFVKIGSRISQNKPTEKMTRKTVENRIAYKW